VEQKQAKKSLKELQKKIIYMGDREVLRFNYIFFGRQQNNQSTKNSKYNLRKILLK
jgi:hypothetical protein